MKMAAARHEGTGPKPLDKQQWKCPFTAEGNANVYSVRDLPQGAEN